jgi:hypothetical protein
MDILNYEPYAVLQKIFLSVYNSVMNIMNNSYVLLLSTGYKICI